MTLLKLEIIAVDMPKNIVGDIIVFKVRFFAAIFEDIFVYKRIDVIIHSLNVS